jgi:hypothetical protein
MMGRIACCLAVAGVLLSTPASARRHRPAVSCEVADFSMTLRLYLPLAFDRSGAPDERGMRGSLEIHHQKVPRERRLWSLDGKRPAQFWNRDGELKLLLVLGSSDEPITLVINTTQRRADGRYAGEFHLLTPEVNLTGRLACEAG